MADAKYKYKDYEESDSVKAAKAALDSYAASKPTYSSKYQDSLNKAMDRILNREKFSYDLNGDMLYQQYKDQYTNLGKAAMKDTMGQAAMLTGGYSNSYANTAGAQAYQGYLGQLNDRIPELYSLALDKYDREGNDLLNQYSLLYDRENQDYSRYRDAVGDYETALGYLADRYDTERSYDYGRYGDDRAYDYQAYRDGVSDAQRQRDYDYQLGRDAVSDAQWRAEFDEAKRQYDADLAEKQRQYDADLTEKQRQYDADIVYKMTKDSKGSNTKSSTKSSDNKYESSFYQTTGDYRFTDQGVLFDKSQYDGFVETVAKSRTVEGRCALIEDAVMEGKITDDQANALLTLFGISDEEFTRLRGID